VLLLYDLSRLRLAPGEKWNQNFGADVKKKKKKKKKSRLRNHNSVIRQRKNQKIFYFHLLHRHH
jgi:hypothetical protein